MSDTDNDLLESIAIIGLSVGMIAWVIVDVIEIIKHFS